MAAHGAQKCLEVRDFRVGKRGSMLGEDKLEVMRIFRRKGQKMTKLQIALSGKLKKKKNSGRNSSLRGRVWEKARDGPGYGQCGHRRYAAKKLECFQVS